MVNIYHCNRCHQRILAFNVQLKGCYDCSSELVLENRGGDSYVVSPVAI